MKKFTTTVVVTGIVLIGPFITIWALNTLFGLAIAFNIKSLLAALWVNVILTGRVSLPNSFLQQKKEPEDVGH